MKEISAEWIYDVENDGGHNDFSLPSFFQYFVSMDAFGYKSVFLYFLSRL